MRRAGPPVVVGVLTEVAVGIALYSAIRPRPPAAPIDGAVPEVALGLAVGICLLVVLAGRLPPRPRFARSRLPALGARA